MARGRIGRHMAPCVIEQLEPRLLLSSVSDVVIPVIEVNNPMAAPTWAVKQRQLLAIDAQIAQRFEDAYVLPNGYLNVDYIPGGGVKAPDDALECIYKFPLVYSLGADDATWDVWWKVWRGSIAQGTELGLFTNEMCNALDWHHNGEQYEGLWLAGLCAPDDLEYIRQSLKFASFFDGSVGDVPNYDPVNAIVRSVLTGGNGALDVATMEDWGGSGSFWDQWMALGGGEVDYDTANNLVTTCWGTNAFLLTGDQSYLDATMEYIDAWRDRAIANGGIIPSRVDRDGTVPADWWDGVLGWDWEMFGGLFQVSSGSRPAWGNALLLTGDDSYYDEIRATADEVWAHRFQTVNGIDVPRYYGSEGWHGQLYNGVQGGLNSAGIYSSMLANLYLATMSAEDLQRILDRPVEGLAGHAAYHEGGYERQWIRYLVGQNATWPVQSLTTCINEAQADLAEIEADIAAGRQFDFSRQVSWCGPLVNQMTGGIMPLWTGQLMLGRFSYFDPQQHRPGIPADCAALVESMSDDGATVLLVNTSQTESRTILVQTGAYGEHQCLSVTPEGGSPVDVNGTLFTVVLAPGTGQRFVVSMDRYANTPTLSLPPGLERVSVAEPVQGATVAAGANVTLAADVFDSGNVTMVEFYADGEKVGQDATAPYSATWCPTTLGAHRVTARALYDDDAGTVAVSGPANVTVAIPGDAHLDWVIDDIDLSLLLNNWDQSGRSWMQGDFTGDGVSDDSDLSMLLTNWGASAETVTVQATDAMAAEQGQDTATFTVVRSGGSPSGGLTVHYTVSGAAESGDYQEILSGAIVIGDGQSSAHITITPVDDAAPENNEMLRLTLSLDAAYVLGSATSQTVFILDNDQPVTAGATDGVAAEQYPIAEEVRPMLRFAKSTPKAADLDDDLVDVLSPAIGG